jgi:hypothetical protein
VLDIIEAVGATGDPAEVFAAIEEDLRARLAIPLGESKWPLQSVVKMNIMATVDLDRGGICQ